MSKELYMKQCFILYLLIFAIFSIAQPTAEPPTTPSPVPTQPTAELPAGLSAETYQASLVSIDRGIAYLRSQMQESGTLFDPGLTALALTSILRSKRYQPSDEEWIAKGLESLISFQKPDGGIYRDQLISYTTSVAIMALTSRPDIAIKYADEIQKAKNFLLTFQYDEGESYTKENCLFYGGIGYGKSGRPDLSNTNLALEALREAGVKADDPAMQKAITFLQNCQNNSETNSQAWASNDGGFIYYPGVSYAGTTTLPNSATGQRSYGSMTYAGIKSYIYANVSQDDPRFKAAWAWVQKNYDLTQNPGIGEQGLFYYYHTFAKTLALMDIPAVIDEQGVAHYWREDLAQTLIAKQLEDGSWKNNNPRWWESEPRLVTSYSVMCLVLCTRLPK